MINKFFYLLLIIIIILICYFIYKEIKKLNKIEKFKDNKCSTNEINELCDKKYIYIKGLKGDKGKLCIKCKYIYTEWSKRKTTIYTINKFCI